jgi:hypothetical protein
MKLQLSLVTNHGNMKGVDHFVKVLIWTSIDPVTGKHKIR